MDKMLVYDPLSKRFCYVRKDDLLDVFGANIYCDEPITQGDAKVSTIDLMYLFDDLYEIMKKNGMNWYVGHATGFEQKVEDLEAKNEELQQKIFELENKISELEEKAEVKCDTISELDSLKNEIERVLNLFME